jgi:hypothetical protein
MYHEREYFNLSFPPESRWDQGFVQFTRSEFSGMVGETIIDYSATLFMQTYNSRKKKMVWLEPKELNYVDLKNLYKKITGKQNRINYYRWTMNFSPEARQAEAEAELADAISRVI